MKNVLNPDFGSISKKKGEKPRLLVIITQLLNGALDTEDKRVGGCSVTVSSKSYDG